MSGLKEARVEDFVELGDDADSLGVWMKRVEHVVPRARDDR